MARLTALPEQAIIDGFKGTVDFYYNNGIPCARKWPHWAKRKPYPAERANQEAFAYAAKMWKDLPEYLKLLYIDMSAGGRFSGFDVYMKCYMCGLPT